MTEENGFTRGREIVLPAERLATLKSAADDPPLEVRYTCANLRERAQACAASATRAPSCCSSR